MGTPTYSGATYGVTKSLANKTSDYNLGNSNVQMYDNYVDIKYEENNNTDTLKNKEESNAKSNLVENNKNEKSLNFEGGFDYANSKFKNNLIFYGGTGIVDYVTTPFIDMIENNALKTGVKYTKDVSSAAFFKLGSGVELKNFFAGGGKKLGTNVTKDLPNVKKNVQKGLEKLREKFSSSRPDISKKTIDLVEKRAKESLQEKVSIKDKLKGKYFDDTYYYDFFQDSYDIDRYMEDFKKSVSPGKLTATYGIDLIWTFGIEVVSNRYFGNMTWEQSVKNEFDADLGKNLLGSVWKTTGQLAFQTVGTAIGGPAFGKVCGAAGSLLGKYVGDFVAETLDNDPVACAVTTGTTIIGVTAGCLTGPLIAAAVCSTVPGVGWVCGAAILVGAALGSGVGILGHKFGWW